MKKRIVSAFLVLALLAFLPVQLTASATCSRSDRFKTNYTLTGYAPDDMVSIARAQNGLTNGYFDYTDYHAWCADFVSDCAKLAGQSSAIPFTASCYNMITYILNAGGYEVPLSSAQRGDIVFYSSSSYPNGGAHVEIITEKCSPYSSGGRWYLNAIGGNNNDAVYERTSTGLSVYKVYRPNYVQPKPSEPAPAVHGDATINDGIYTLLNAGSGYAMNYSYATSNPNPIIMSVSGDEDAGEQHFRFVHTGGGKYRLEITHADGGVVNCECAAPVYAGAAITGRSYTDNDTQKFYVTPMGDGTYILQSANNTNLVIAAPSDAWHANLCLQNYSSSNNLQRWIFDPDPTIIAVSDTDSEIVDSDTDIIDTDSEIVDSDTDIIDTDSEIIDSDTDIIDTDSEVVDSDTDSENTDIIDYDTDSDSDTDSEDTDTDKRVRELGDVLFDYAVDSSDALRVLRYSVGLETVPIGDLEYGDMTGDGIVDSSDALAILRISAGIG